MQKKRMDEKETKMKEKMASKHDCSISPATCLQKFFSSFFFPFSPFFFSLTPDFYAADFLFPPLFLTLKLHFSIYMRSRNPKI